MHKQFTYADASLSMVSRAGGDGELSKQTTDEQETRVLER